MRIITLGLSLSGQHMAFDESETDALLDTVKEMLPELALGDRLQIEIVDMEESAYLELPEFEGW